MNFNDVCEIIKKDKNLCTTTREMEKQGHYIIYNKETEAYCNGNKMKLAEGFYVIDMNGDQVILSTIYPIQYESDKWYIRECDTFNASIDMSKFIYRLRDEIDIAALSHIIDYHDESIIEPLMLIYKTFRSTDIIYATIYDSGEDCEEFLKYFKIESLKLNDDDLINTPLASFMTNGNYYIICGDDDWGWVLVPDMAFELLFEKN